VEKSWSKTLLKIPSKARLLEARSRVRGEKKTNTDRPRFHEKEIAASRERENHKGQGIFWERHGELGRFQPLKISNIPLKKDPVLSLRSLIEE